jgi:hypothetical protein
VVVFRPAGKITVDRQARAVRDKTPWSMQSAIELPLLDLAMVTVEAAPGGLLHRLLLTYRDGSRRPLTEHFYYGEEYHRGVALALNAAVGGPLLQSFNDV